MEPDSFEEGAKRANFMAVKWAGETCLRDPQIHDGAIRDGLMKGGKPGQAEPGGRGEHTHGIRDMVGCRKFCGTSGSLQVGGIRA